MTEPTRAELLVAAALLSGAGHERIIDANAQMLLDGIMRTEEPELVTHALARARALLGDEWQPISTAPKDGTAILLCVATDADGKPIRPCSFGTSFQVAMWWEAEGWIVYCSLPREPILHFDPTHWRPLPAPPQGGDRG